jgi:hypothetical protein
MLKLINILMTLVIVPIWMGCSVVGFVVGSSIDSHAHDTLSIGQANNLHAGDNIALRLINGEGIECEYRSLETIPFIQDDSAKRYSQPITFLSGVSGVRRSGRLVGFDHDTVWIQLDGNQDFSPFSLEKAKEIMNDQSQIIALQDLKRMAPRLPLQHKRLLNVIVGNTDRQFPLDDILQIRYNKTSSKWIWLATGATIDAAIIGFGMALHNSFIH